jgi:iron complex outermembrane receptor protein
MRVRGLLLTGFVLAATALHAGAVWGQGADPAADPAPEQEKPAAPPPRAGIEEIVIQAGESESAADFQAADSVTGFDASDLEALGAQSVAELSKFTPNLEIVTSGATTPTFFIRGVGLNDFNANSTGAVAIYQDDVPVNSPALQLGTLFDMEAVNVLRGPQGTGPARNASAGAIKLYSRRPSGEYGAYLRSSFGNYNYKDFEGAVESPIYEDILAARLAFRWSQRDGYAENGCGDVPVVKQRDVSYCGESLFRRFSQVPAGLPSRVNDLGNWAARGTFLFQPTLDMEWLLGVHGSRRDEQTRLGQAYGTRGTLQFADGTTQFGFLGGQTGANPSQQYVDPDVTQMQEDANPCTGIPARDRPPECRNQPFPGGGTWNPLRENAKAVVADEVGENLDIRPHRGDYNLVGPTQNDVWGAYLKGDVVLGSSLFFTTVTGYDNYDRFIVTDLDFTPNTQFEITTDDAGWQFTQDLRLAGQISETIPLRWEIGVFGLMEKLDVFIDNDFGIAGFAQVANREYTQKLWSAAGYVSFEWDFWNDFTLDGGVRYNWERKTIDYDLDRGPNIQCAFCPVFEKKTWQDPTGTIRLTYRFREDTHAYWKYTRGWKGGHFNATSSLNDGVTDAEPETIDAFEAGLRGSWFGGRLGMDLSLFYYNYTNYQIFTIENKQLAPPEFVILNADRSEVYGSEIDLIARLLPGLFLNARFSWLESQFLDFVQIQELLAFDDNGLPAGVTRVESQFSGNRMLNSPRFKVSLTADQTVPLGRWGSVSVRWDGAWTDTTYFDATEGVGIPNAQGQIFLPDNTIGQKAFWLHNLRMAYRPPTGNIEIAGWVRNLTDEAYRSFSFNASNFQSTTIHFIGEPRTYGLSFSVNF